MNRTKIGTQREGSDTAEIFGCEVSFSDMLMSFASRIQSFQCFNLKRLFSPRPESSERPQFLKSAVSLVKVLISERIEEIDKVLFLVLLSTNEQCFSVVFPSGISSLLS